MRTSNLPLHREPETDVERMMSNGKPLCVWCGNGVGTITCPACWNWTALVRAEKLAREGVVHPCS